MHSDKKTNILPLDATELLRIAHDLAKIDVEHMATVFDHDVVIVSITYAQNECGDTPAGTRVKEVHYRLKVRCETNTSYWQCGKSSEK